MVFSCGRSCRRWHLGPGVNRDVPLGPGHLGRCSGRRQAVQTDQRYARNVRDPSRVLEQGPDRQRTPVGCSGGVSSISGASESRCSHDGSGGQGRQEQRGDRHRSSPEAMGLHEGGFTTATRTCVQERYGAGRRAGGDGSGCISRAAAPRPVVPAAGLCGGGGVINGQSGGHGVIPTDLSSKSGTPQLYPSRT
jgi:hypothetical protein